MGFFDSVASFGSKAIGGLANFAEKGWAEVNSIGQKASDIAHTVADSSIGSALLAIDPEINIAVRGGLAAADGALGTSKGLYSGLFGQTEKVGTGPSLIGNVFGQGQGQPIADKVGIQKPPPKDVMNPFIPGRPSQPGVPARPPLGGSGGRGGRGGGPIRSVGNARDTPRELPSRHYYVPGNDGARKRRGRV